MTSNDPIIADCNGGNWRRSHQEAPKHLQEEHLKHDKGGHMVTRSTLKLQDSLVNKHDEHREGVVINTM